MVALNFTVPSNFSLTVGGVDFTKSITQLSISRPLPEARTPQTWTGRITLTDRLAQPALLPEPLNPITNTNQRWERACFQVLIKIGSSPITPPLYILRYSYDDATGIAELQVGDDLTLRNDAKPGQSYRQLGYLPASTPIISGLLERACLSVGLPNYDFSAMTATMPAARDKPSGSWVEWAQTHTGERGNWMYVGTDGKVRVQAYPQLSPTTPTPLFTRARSRVDTYKPILVETPLEKYVVTGSTLKPTPAPTNIFTPVIERNYDSLPVFNITQAGNVTAGFVNAVVRLTTTQVLTSTATSLVRQITVQEALGALDPIYYPGNTGLVTTRVTTETHTADSVEGKVRQIVTASNVPLPAISSEMSTLVNEIIQAGLPSTTTAAQVLALSAAAKLVYWQRLLTSAMLTVEVFEDGGIFSPTRGMMVSRTKTSYGFRRVGLTDYYSGCVVDQEFEKFTANSTTITFGTATPPPAHYTRDFKHYVRPESTRIPLAINGSSKLIYSPRGLNIVEDIVEPGAAPGQFPTLKAGAEVGTVAIAGQATYLPVTASPYYLRYQEDSSQTLTTSGECNFYAKIIGDFAHQSYRGRSTNLPIPSEWLSNPAPFQVAAIHDGLFVLCNDSINMVGDKLEIAWTMYRLGYLSPVVAEAGSWTPTTPSNTYTTTYQVERTGATPSIAWTTPAGDWLRGSAVTRTGATPGIVWSVATGGFTQRRTGATPVINWSAPSGADWVAALAVRTGNAPVLRWLAPAGNWSFSGGGGGGGS